MVIQLNKVPQNWTVEKKRFSVLNVGVGGQGIIRTTQILAWAALMDGYQVRTAETHGMAQRGGSVSAYLRFGPEVASPLIPRGHVDIILALEISEALRVFNFSGPNTYFFINNKIIIPPMVSQMGFKYPSNENLCQQLKNLHNNIYFFDADKLALKAGTSKALNVVMLGILLGSDKLPIKEDSLKHSILRFIPKKSQEVNRIAFQLGIDKGKSIRRELL